MNPKRILLTGDDGYNSIGIRLLINALKDDHELHIAATKHQQSGVGGKISVYTDSSWEEIEVDCVPGIAVEGPPADAAECASVHFSEKFDLILSGINLGLNVGAVIISSGTYGGMTRGFALELAPKAIALSWNVPYELMLKKHDESENLKEYQEHFHKILKPLFKKIFAENMWDVDILNINFPEKPSNKIRFTKMSKSVRKVFEPLEVDRETRKFSYKTSLLNITEDNPRYDAGALKQGYISITPCAFDPTHFTTFEKLEKTKLKI